MNDYETMFWYINEEKKAPLGADRYYPLMKMIMIKNNYMDKEYIEYNGMLFFNYVIAKTCNDLSSWKQYYHQTLLVLGTFDKLYNEDKEKAMNMNTDNFIKLLKEEDSGDKQD